MKSVDNLKPVFLFVKKERNTVMGACYSYVGSVKIKYVFPYTNGIGAS